MSRKAQTFRQSDVMRAIKAVRACGEEIVRIEIDKDGRIVIVTREGPPIAAANGGENDPAYQKWLHED